MKNIFDWKTTSLGMLLMAANISYLFVNSSPSFEIVGFMTTSSLGLILAPDKVIDSIKSKLTGKNGGNS